MAYSPGVAYPCMEILQNPEKIDDYTDHGNLVAVISNGTAVLGLGNIGAKSSQTGDGRESSLIQNLRRARRVRH